MRTAAAAGVLGTEGVDPRQHAQEALALPMAVHHYIIITESRILTVPLTSCIEKKY